MSRKEIKVFEREIKFKKNLESGDINYYNNLNITVRLDRMINYMMAESSKDNKGLLSDSIFNDKLKSPFANFYNDVVVVVSAKTSTGTIVTKERKPITFKIGNGSQKYLDFFKKFFNINQNVISIDPLISEPPSDFPEIEKRDKSLTNTSPLVLCLSSYDNRAFSGFNENREFSNDLIPGCGRGGVIIYPRVFGYLINITDTNLKSKGIKPSKINNINRLESDNRLFFKITDIEDKTFNYDDIDGIIPCIGIDNGNLRVFTINKNILDNNDNTSLLGMSKIDKDHAFQNQYLKLFNRELIKEEIQQLAHFVLNNEGTKNFASKSFPLFKIEKEVRVSGILKSAIYTTIDPIYLEVKTDNPDEKPGQLIINFKMDFETEISDETLSNMDDLKNLDLSSGGYSSQNFVIYN